MVSEVEWKVQIMAGIGDDPESPLWAGGLTEDEQREVWEATRTPQKIRWPEWWVVRG